MGPRTKRLRVVLDTSALISALLYGGEPGRLVKLWETGRIVPLVSREVLLEYLRVLGYRKFKLSEEHAKRLIEEKVLPFAKMVAVPETPRIVPEDAGDDKFLALAEAGNAPYLVSGDRHLLKLGTYREVAILTPRQFLDKMK